MSGHYLDGDTLDLCHQAIRDGKTLDDVAEYLHLGYGAARTPVAVATVAA